jgi:uncharacterized protein YdcH (DUF465 family)
MVTMTAYPWEPRLARLEGAYEQIDKRFGDLIANMDARFAQVDARFAQVDARFAQVDARFAQVDSRFAQIDARIDDLDHKIDGLSWRMTALIVGTWITTMIAILLHH